ncbi:hypothetical protein SRHO_G00060470 [Serrasalmus rhombeus]
MICSLFLVQQVKGCLQNINPPTIIQDPCSPRRYNAACMRLYLAVAVLMLVVGAQAVLKQRHRLEKLEESEFATKTKSWFDEQMSKIKDTFGK